VPIDPAIRDKLRTVRTAAVTAALARHGLHHQLIQGLRPLSPTQDTLVGEAHVVRDSGPLARRAIMECPPGAVLVVDGSREPIPVARLLERRIAGIVTDGVLRGATEIARSGLPAFHRPTGAAATLAPIAAGDTILGRPDGVVAIPAHLAGEIAEEAQEMAAYEEFLAEQVSAGGGVYGLHIPSGEQARIAFAAWRKMRGR
jgi:regulator of RNase E activity RraA